MTDNKKYRKIFGVEGIVTKFDQKLFDKYDIPARNIIKNKLGDFVLDNPNIYGEDLIIKNDKCKYKYLEIQVYAEWDIKFPYTYPFIYARKMRYSEDTLFVVLNKNMTKCILFNRKSVSNHSKRIRKYSREIINLIPWNAVLQIEIEDLTNDIIMNF